MAKTVPGGLVVLFEGIDGIGKSTQLQLTQDLLTGEDWAVHATRNLGGTPIGEALREAMLTPVPRPALTDLYTSVAIQEALLEAIATERAAGKIILLDRSPLSLAAYQIYGSGIDEAKGWPYVTSGMEQLKPDLTLLYSGDIATAVERARAHSGQDDYFESKSLEYFTKVASGYKIVAERYNVLTIDADRSIEAVHADTMAAISRLLSQD